jgi:hypothetical protein
MGRIFENESNTKWEGNQKSEVFIILEFKNGKDI